MISLNFMTDTELSGSLCFQVPDPLELKAVVCHSWKKKKATQSPLYSCHFIGLVKSRIQRDKSKTIYL